MHGESTGEKKSTEAHKAAGVGNAVGDPCVGDGTFYLNSRVQIRNFKDGTTKTIVVGERKSDTATDPMRLSTWDPLRHRTPRVP